MTAETDERSGVSKVSKVEFEEKSPLNLSSCEDLGKVGEDCNGIVHDGAEEIDGDVKDDGDGSFVSVNGSNAISDDLREKDLDAECVVDPTETVEAEPVLREIIAVELNVGSASEEKPVQVMELMAEKGDNDQSRVENGYRVEEIVVSSSTNDITVEDSLGEYKGDGIEKIDTVEEENKIELATEVSNNQESSITITEAIESKFDREEKVEEKSEFESTSEVESSSKVEENQESQVTDVLDELQPLNNEEKKAEEVDNGEEVEEVDNGEKNKIDWATEVEENRESQIMVTQDVESELHQLHNQEEQSKLESASEVEESQESQVTSIKDIEFESDKLDTGEKEIRVIDQIPVEDLARGRRAEQDHMLDESVSPVNSHLETEAANGSDESGMTLPSCPAEHIASATEVVNELAEGQENMHTSPTANIESKCENVDVSPESLCCPVEDLISKTEVENKIWAEQDLMLDETVNPVNSLLETEAANGSDESGTTLPACPAEHIASATEVVNESAEGEESMHTCPTANIESKCENVDVSPESLCCPVEDLISETEVENISSIEYGESLHTGPVDNMRSETEVRNAIEISESFPVDDTNSEINVGISSVEGVDSVPTCPADDMKSKTETGNGSIEGNNSEPTCPVEDVEMESEVMKVSSESARSLPNFHVNDVEIESEVLNRSVGSGISLPTCHAADMELESEVGNGSGAGDGDMPSADVVKLEAKIQFGSFGISETAPRYVFNVIDVENGQSTSGESDGKPICQEDIEGIKGEEGPQLSPDGSTADALDEQKVDKDLGKKTFHFLIRIPRYVDDNLPEQTRLAQLQVEERTQSRDAIRATIQLNRVTCNEYRDKFEAAKAEERAARDALNAKRQEIDSVQSALSIEDIDDSIHSMEHMIQHETMPLKEEKRLIREIKQLKHAREQLASNMGRQDEHQQARDRTEERFKLLKQELDSLRKKLSQTEGVTKAAKEKYFGESEKLRKLQAQFNAADALRQEAYTHLQNLRKELHEKNKYFRMYRDEQRAANDYASTGDWEALQRLCVNQVETIMEQWNKNDEFRNEYIRCNTRSTLRRLRTLDGRSLGPDEEPPVLCNFVDERVDNALLASSKINSALINSPLEPEKLVAPLGFEKTDAKSMVKVERKNPTAKSEKATKPTALENVSVTVSGREEKDEAEEENRKTEEEEELARKAEELRKVEAAAKLKEQRQLEKAKAMEAEERKRRKTEKAQARAELRTQKEAELKEKEREKRARKKEKKKVAAAEAINGVNEGESAPIAQNTLPETTQESEIKEKPTAVAKRPQKPSLLAKKTKPLPPPLRNKGKRRFQTWMWVLSILIALAILLVGNIGFSFTFGLPSLGF